MRLLHDSRYFMKLATRKKVVFMALKVALIVGTILNLINQGHVFKAPDFFASLAYGKLFLTYCVPYLVSTYSSVATLRRLSN